ncbi:unnamed protein product [Ectocarpus sp. 12 AP-2014]
MKGSVILAVHRIHIGPGKHQHPCRSLLSVCNCNMEWSPPGTRGCGLNVFSSTSSDESRHHLLVAALCSREFCHQNPPSPHFRQLQLSTISPPSLGWSCLLHAAEGPSATPPTVAMSLCRT